jgi:hypothetical protein
MNVDAVNDRYPVISMKTYTKTRLAATLGDRTSRGTHRSAQIASAAR